MNTSLYYYNLITFKLHRYIINFKLILIGVISQKASLLAIVYLQISA